MVEPPQKESSQSIQGSAPARTPVVRVMSRLLVQSSSIQGIPPARRSLLTFMRRLLSRSRGKRLLGARCSRSWNVSSTGPEVAACAELAVQVHGTSPRNGPGPPVRAWSSISGGPEVATSLKLGVHVHRVVSSVVLEPGIGAGTKVGVDGHQSFSYQGLPPARRSLFTFTSCLPFELVVLEPGVGAGAEVGCDRHRRDSFRSGNRG